jgi:hypothetical protein
MLNPDTLSFALITPKPKKKLDYGIERITNFRNGRGSHMYGSNGHDSPSDLISHLPDSIGRRDIWTHLAGFLQTRGGKLALTLSGENR